MKNYPLTRDVAFNRHSLNDGEHVSPYDNGEIHRGLEGITVQVVQDFHDEELKHTLSRASRATIGWDLDGPSDDREWEELLRGGLQTALETQVVVFEVAGVSRTCTHQLVRSRRAAFHQQSQRASFMGDNPDVRIPDSVWNNMEARIAFREAAEAAHRAYRIACEQPALFCPKERQHTFCASTLYASSLPLTITGRALSFNGRLFMSFGRWDASW